MKKAIKIIIIVLVIALIGVAVYFTFFDIDRNLSVYNNMYNTMQYRYDIDFDQNMYGLNNSENINEKIYFIETNVPDIYSIRQKLFKTDEKLVGGTAENEMFYYYGYVKYEDFLVEGLRFYSNYAVLADHAGKMYANKINSLADDYKSSMLKLADLSKDLVDKHLNIYNLDSTVTVQDFINDYENLRSEYRNHLKKLATLYTELRDFVISESFNNVYSFDTVCVLFDSVAETIKTAMKDNLEQEINYLNDASVYIDLYNEYKENHAINYGIANEINYLNAYTKMYLNNREDYNRIFEFTHFQKKDLIHGNNNISAQIKVGYVDYAKIIVSILGI